MKRAALLVVLFSAAPVLAQTRPKRETYPVATQRLDITEGDTVKGDVPSGEGSMTTSTRRARKPSLIRARTDFMPEMLRSAENL